MWDGVWNGTAASRGAQAGLAELRRCLCTASASGLCKAGLLGRRHDGRLSAHAAAVMQAGLRPGTCQVQAVTSQTARLSGGEFEQRWGRAHGPPKPYASLPDVCALGPQTAPGKRGRPRKSSAAMQPRDHMSIAMLYACPSSTCTAASAG